MTIPRQTANALRFETPTAKDGAAMWELVSRSTLDQNSAYKYIMMGHYFAETCVLAKADNKLAGFATAFIPPGQEDVVFIWQIGVDSSQRGKGLATKMINELIQREVCKNVRYVEATITPSNKASQSLFRRLAREHQTNCEVMSCFDKSFFPGDSHEEEKLFRVGPLQK